MSSGKKEDIIRRFENGEHKFNLEEIVLISEYLNGKGIIFLNPNNPDHQDMLKEMNEKLYDEEMAAIREIQDQIWEEEKMMQDIQDQIEQEQNFMLAELSDEINFTHPDFGSRKQLRGILDECYKFLINEEKIENDENDAKKKLSIREKMLKGYIIPNAIFERRQGNINTFLVRLNLSKFTKGQSLFIYTMDGEKIGHKVCEAKYWSEGPNWVKVKIKSNPTFSKSERYVLQESYGFSKSGIESALIFINGKDDIYQRLETLISLNNKQTYDLSEDALSYANTYLSNEAQRKAFLIAVGQKTLSLIQGPPGTGKTFLLAHLATYFSKIGKRVLITGFTHSSIHNALNKLVEIDPALICAKFGSYERSEEGLDPRVLRFEREALGQMDFLMKEGSVVGATVFEAVNRLYRKCEFDIVIIDEASQMNLALSICALSITNKTIMIGDHKQLAPIIKGVYKENYKNQSLFEYFFNRYDGLPLNDTFRLSPSLTHFPSTHFYGGKLKSIVDIQKKEYEFYKNLSIYGTSSDRIWVKYQNKRRNRIRNKKETKIISELVGLFVSQGVKEEDIGIIAPFRAQVRNILSEIGFERSVEVDTVDKYQGREKAIIIVSLVSNDERFLNEVSEFYFDTKRFNVSISRAKCKIVFVGDSRFIQFDLQNEGFNLLRTYLIKCKQIFL